MLAYFESLEHLVEQARTPAHGSAMGSRLEGHAETMGTASFEQAECLAIQGWPEGLAAMRALLDPLAESLRSIEAYVRPYHTRFDVSGEILHPDRAAQGEPDCWETPVGPEDIDCPRFITLFSDLSSAAACSDADLLAHAASVVGAAQLLSQLGCSVRVACGTGLEPRPPHAGERIEVHVQLRPLSPYDACLRQVTFGLAQRSLVQRLVASIAEQSGRPLDRSQPSAIHDLERTSYDSHPVVTQPARCTTPPTSGHVLAQAVTMVRAAGLQFPDCIVPGLA